MNFKNWSITIRRDSWRVEYFSTHWKIFTFWSVYSKRNKRRGKKKSNRMKIVFNVFSIYFQKNCSRKMTNRHRKRRRFFKNFVRSPQFSIWSIQRAFVNRWNCSFSCLTMKINKSIERNFLFFRISVFFSGRTLWNFHEENASIIRTMFVGPWQQSGENIFKGQHQPIGWNSCQSLFASFGIGRNQSGDRRFYWLFIENFSPKRSRHERWRNIGRHHRWFIDMEHENNVSHLFSLFIQTFYYQGSFN